jgi:hypothetical protein
MRAVFWGLTYLLLTTTETGQGTYTCFISKEKVVCEINLSVPN